MEWEEQAYTRPYALRHTGLQLILNEVLESSVNDNMHYIFNSKVNHGLSERGPERDTHLSTLFIAGANSYGVFVPEQGSPPAF